MPDKVSSADIRGDKSILLDTTSGLVQEGYCWTAVIPARFEPGDSLDAPTASRLLVYEDDRKLGPSHTPHETIRQTGGGAYSHWHNTLYFSTSDNSDPRTNGRKYRVTLGSLLSSRLSTLRDKATQWVSTLRNKATQWAHGIRVASRITKSVRIRLGTTSCEMGEDDVANAALSNEKLVSRITEYTRTYPDRELTVHFDAGRNLELAERILSLPQVKSIILSEQNESLAAANSSLIGWIDPVVGEHRYPRQLGDTIWRWNFSDRLSIPAMHHFEEQGVRRFTYATSMLATEVDYAIRDELIRAYRNTFHIDLRYKNRYGTLGERIGRFIDDSSWKFGLRKLFRDPTKLDSSRENGDRSGIILITSSLGPGGAERQLVNTAIGLQSLGNETVKVLCLSDTQGTNAFYEKWLTREGIEIIYLPHTPNLPLESELDSRLFQLWSDVGPSDGVVENLARIAMQLRQRKPRVVHCWLDSTNIAGGCAAILTSVPRILISTHAFSPIHFAWLQPYMHPGYRILDQHPNVRFSNNSAAGAKDYARWLGISASRIAVVHNGVDKRQVAPVSPHDVDTYRNRVGLVPDDVVVGTILRFTEEKRPLLWAQIAEIVAQVRSDVKFLMIGDGPLKQEVRAFAKSANLCDRFIMPGLEQNVALPLAVMNCFLLTSRLEGLPNVLLEAQLAGVPVITSAVGGAPEALEQGQTGWAIQSDDPRLYAERILELLDDVNRRQTVTQAGPEFVANRFGLQRMVSETAKLYGISDTPIDGAGHSWSPRFWRLATASVFRRLARRLLPESVRRQLIQASSPQFWLLATASIPRRLARRFLPEPVRRQLIHASSLSFWRLATASALRRLARRLLPESVRRQLVHAYFHLEGRLKAAERRFEQRRISLKNFRPIYEARAFSGGPILMINNALASGGVERQIVNSLRALERRTTVDVGLLCLRLGHAPELDFFKPALADFRGVVRNIMPLAEAEQIFQQIPPRRSTQLRRAIAWMPTDVQEEILRLAAEFIKLKPSVVHAWQDNGGISATYAARLVGVPRILISSRNVRPTNFAWYRPYMKLAHHEISACRDVVMINNSDAGANDYSQWLQIPVKRFVVKRNGFDMDAAKRVDTNLVARTRAQLNIPQHAAIVGSIFRFYDEKRPLLWVQIASEVAARRPETHFVVFGDGPLLHASVALAHDLGIGGRFHAPGLSDAMVGLSLFDVFLLTSQFEGTPNVVLEASALGVPVVATEAGGTREAIEQNVTGFVVDSAEPGKIADRIVAILEDPAWRHNAREAGPAFIERRFGLARMIDETLALYETPQSLKS